MPEFRETGESRNPFEGSRTTTDTPRPVEPGDLIIREREKTIQENLVEVEVEVEYLDTSVKSENDKKDYRVIKLPNGLKALLVSDLQSISTVVINEDNDETVENQCCGFPKPAHKENHNSEDSESGEGVGQEPENVDSTKIKFHSDKDNMALLGLDAVQSISLDGIIANNEKKDDDDDCADKRNDAQSILVPAMIDDNKKNDINDCDKKKGSAKDGDCEEDKDELAVDDLTSVNVEDQKLPRIEEKLAACGLCVTVNSFSNPPEIPGLAHFLEHMVFMGSEKYPQENDYFNFIENHGGFSNATTGSKRTTFHFEIQGKRIHRRIFIFKSFAGPIRRQEGH